MQESNKLTFETMFQRKIEQLNKSLEEHLPRAPLQIAIIEDALSYSLLAGGKRIRPLLLIMTAELCGSDAEIALPAACAVEFVHTYSLIHDDLPAMDDDDLRRGKPTSHKVFGEAIAVLAGDALLTHAFELLTKYDPEIMKQLITILVGGAGINGMLGGQVADMLAEKANLSENNLFFIHRYKTAALITASVLMGAVIAGATDEIKQKLLEFSQNLGLAFQVIDDVLDVTGEESQVGKKVRKDQENNKCTFPAVFGVEKSQGFAKEYTEKARNALSEVHNKMLEISKKSSAKVLSEEKIKLTHNNLQYFADFLLTRKK